jgi:large subunit ribosomal protein L28e
MGATLQKDKGWGARQKIWKILKIHLSTPCSKHLLAKENMSSDLLWLLTRSSNSFLVKRGNSVLSKEPGNLTGAHSLKASGLASDKPVVVAAGPGNKGVTVSLRKTKKVPAAKVSKAYQTVTLTKGSRSVSKSVAGLVKAYRADLVPMALARAGRILQAQAPVKPRAAKKTRGSKK